MKYIMINRLSRLSFGFLLWGASCCSAVSANQSVSELMQIMQSETAVRITYQETRTMALFAEAWQGSGYMYAVSPGLMIREQLKPSPILMGIHQSHIYYVDNLKGIKHRGKLDDNHPNSLNIIAFQALINADEQLLRRFFSIQFESNTDRWLMLLTPKNAEYSDMTIEVSGLNQQQPNSIIVYQSDGDKTEFRLKKDQQGEQIKTLANALLQQLQGE